MSHQEAYKRRKTESKREEEEEEIEEEIEKEKEKEENKGKNDSTLVSRPCCWCRGVVVSA